MSDRGDRPVGCDPPSGAEPLRQEIERLRRDLERVERARDRLRRENERLREHLGLHDAGHHRVTVPVNVSAKATLVGGCFHQVVNAGDTRILRIALAHEPRYSDHSMAVLGHELRHALEILESPDARTEADVDALYGRIGYVRGGGIVETDAALDMGHQIEKELSASHRSTKKD